MSPSLTQVPATLPGVVRRGTPLVTVEPVFVGGIACAAGMQCISGGPPDSAGQVLVLCALGSIVLPLSWLAVDLDDATGRAHVASALAAYNMLRSPNGVLWWWDWRAWRLQCSKDSMGFSVVGSDNLCTKVSALSDLDPDDPTLLPDGSRWVDAEALARVLLHVLGGER